MKKLDIENENFTRIDTPDSPANNLNFDIVTLMNNSKNKMSVWSIWTNKKHDSLYIEFNAENRTAIDMLEVHLKRLDTNYQFDFGFVNPSTHELTDHFKGSDPKGALYISNILYRATATA